jgi:hypothetical protein
MSVTNHKGGAMRARTTLSVLLIAAALSPAGAYAKYDAPPTGTEAGVSGGQDLRSPDAREAAGTAALPGPQDLRSPDARDAAAGASLASAVAATHAAPSVSDGFEWGDAGIGAGVMLILLTLASGTVLVAVRTRRRTT